MLVLNMNKEIFFAGKSTLEFDFRSADLATRLIVGCSCGEILDSSYCSFDWFNQAIGLIVNTPDLKGIIWSNFCRETPLKIQVKSEFYSFQTLFKGGLYGYKSHHPRKSSTPKR